jgi:hypothetical protein
LTLLLFVAIHPELQAIHLKTEEVVEKIIKKESKVSYFEII